jgi:phosphotriesterase-related protein
MTEKDSTSGIAEGTDKGMATTVTGEVEAGSLGVTLSHEHVIHKISIHSGNPDNTFVDREAGGGTVCDMTPVGIGRDPKALQEVSINSGVHIASGVGLYQLDVWPDELRRMSRTELADFIVREVNGESTGVKAAIIGEIASHNEPHHADWREYRLWDEEREIFHAVADAQQRTGLCVATHASTGRGGVTQLEAMIEAGGDPQRVVIGHCDCQMHEDIEKDLEYYHELLGVGASLEFDLFGWGGEHGSDAERCKRVSALVDEGFSDRLVLSTDTCRLSQLHQNGGRGFDYLFTGVLPGLREAGVPEEGIRQMTVINPGRVLTNEK